MNKTNFFISSTLNQSRYLDDRNEVACDVSSVGSSAVQSKKLLSCRDDDDLITINNKAHCASNANSLSGIKVPKSDANDHSHHFPFLVANSNSNNNNYNCDVGSYLLSKKANTCLASLLKAKKLSTKGKLTSSRSTNCSKKKSELLMFIETYTLEEIASSHGEIAQEEVMATVVGAKSGCHSNNNRQKEENNDSSSCSSVSELDGDDYEDTKKGTCDIYNDSSDTNAIGSITEFDDDDDEDVSQDKEVCEEFEGDDEDGDRTSSFGSVGDTEELIVESLQDKESNDRDDGGCGREETFSIDSILNGYETRYVKKFLGKKGSALGEFCSPLSLAISPNQDFLYIADSQNNRVQYLNAQHDTFKSIKFLSNLRNMSASKQFSHPSSVCVAKSGNIAIADTGNHRVVIADNIGRSILDIGQKGTINSRFMHPSSVTFDNMNFLYVCDEMNKRIQVFSADGRFVGKWGGGNSTVFSQPTHIACYTPNQTLYVIDKGDHSIKVFDRNGMKINCIKSITESALEEASLPMNIFSDERDSLHVLTNTNKIQTLSCDGSLISSVDLFPKEELSHCRLHDVVFWQKKFVVSDKENHRIIFF